MLAMKAMSMPAPAISPSSEMPRYAVGMKEKNPAASPRGCERERRAGPQCRVRQRDPQIVHLVPLGTVAHAELDAEINSYADAQDRKGDRDDIERAGHQQAECGRDGEADHEGQEDRENDPPRAQREPQNTKDDEHGRNAVDEPPSRTVENSVVRNRNHAGEAHVGPELLLEAQIRRSGGSRRSPPSRLEGRVIQHRADLDEAPQVPRPSRLARRKLPP